MRLAEGGGLAVVSLEQLLDVRGVRGFGEQAFLVQERQDAHGLEQQTEYQHSISLFNGYLYISP